MTAVPDPLDNRAYRFPVSIKGVVIRDAQVILLENERREWELPGGKLEPGESPERCLAREIAEELQLDVAVDRILDSWVYEITPDTRVLIVTYGCRESSQQTAVLSDEHKQLRWFSLDHVAGLRMPEGYRQSITTWSRLLMR
jgi:8-oxo-dGTP pyrophosphatase MutT (NUDIX family)